MKRNHFGQAYCASLREIVLELGDADASEVYLASIDPPEKLRFGFTGDVARNDDGDTVLYIEADTEAGVRALAKEAGIEDRAELQEG